MPPENLQTEVVWTVFPAQDRRLRTTLVSVFLLGLLFLIFLFYGTIWLAVALVVFFFSLNQYFVPSRYRLDDKTILIDRFFFKSRREWKDFRASYPTRAGVVLSPFPHPTWRNNFRGIHLLLPAEPRRSEILTFITTHLPQGQSPGTATGHSD